MSRQTAVITDRLSMTTRSEVSPTAGLLLAGGASTRMGGRDKAQCDIAGRSLMMRVVERLEPQCVSLVLNSNEEPAHFSEMTLPLVADQLPGRQGPLAGLLAGFDWIKANCAGIEWVLSASIDCPFLPRDLVSRLHEARRAADASIVAARSGQRTHHVIALWRLSLRGDLRAALDQGFRQVGAFGQRHRTTFVEWPCEPFDPFFNINTPEDLAEAQRLAEIIGA